MLTKTADKVMSTSADELLMQSTLLRARAGNRPTLVVECKSGICMSDAAYHHEVFASLVTWVQHDATSSCTRAPVVWHNWRKIIVQMAYTIFKGSVRYTIMELGAKTVEFHAAGIQVIV
jgi:hypothetical protein